MSGLMEGLARPKNGKKAEVYNIHRFAIIVSVGFPIFVLSYAVNSYFLMGIYSLLSLMYFVKISVNHGNNFKVIHLMTKRRVPLWILVAILGQALLNSASKETENYLNEIGAIKTKCRMEKFESDNFKIATVALRGLALGATLTEAGFAEVARLAAESSGIRIKSSSLIGKILINMGSDLKSKHVDGAYEITDRANDVVNSKCERVGFVWYGVKRTLYGMFDILVYVFHYPLVFIAFPVVAVIIAFRSVRSRRKEIEE